MPLVRLLTLFVVNQVLLFRYVKQNDFCAWWLVTFIGIGVLGGAVASLTDGGLRAGDTAMATGVGRLPIRLDGLRSPSGL